MTNAYTFENDPFVEKFGKDVFRSNIKALRPTMAAKIAGVTIAACAAVVMTTVVALNPLNASPSETQGAVATKSDRVVTASAEGSSMPSACDGQAWGAYSANCAAALTGQNSVRAVSFRTIERPADNSNTTVLARVPSNG